MFGGRSNVSRRAVYYHNAQLRGSLDINIVNPNSCSCYDLEIRSCCEKLGGDFGLRSNKECFVVGYYLDQLIGCQAFPLVDFKCGSKKGQTVRREFFGAEDLGSIRRHGGM